MIRIATLITAMLVLVTCAEAPEPVAPRAVTPAIIPMPASLTVGEGAFVVTAATPVIAVTDAPAEVGAADAFRDLVGRTTGLHLAGQGEGVAIRFNQIQTLVAEPQGSYSLHVAADGVTITSSTETGLYYGGVTLWQMLTSGGMDLSAGISLPALTITDAPRFKWRGLMLDVARHFRSVDYVKQFLNWMAIHKLNTFHWHLTDDQGWRIEIRKYPKLTGIGAWRVPPGDAPRADIDEATGEPRLYGGFYTQDEVREIVAYAAARHITIVPEIEMPGHALAPLVAYPEFGADAGTPQTSSDWGVFNYLYNTEDETFQFLEDVLTEVMELFPSEYIHVGGDEAVKDRWKTDARVQAHMARLGITDEMAMQSWFIGRIETFLNSHGRRLIGWDEILEGGIAPNATVMSWRGLAGGIEAARLGHDVVMTPHPILYFDFLQSASRHEPTGRPTVQSLRTVYAFDPIPPELSESEAKHVLGAQANIWTEHMRTADRVTHMTYPKAAAVAEMTWSPVGRKDFDGFMRRLVPMLDRYQALDLHYADTAFEVQFEAEASVVGATVSLHNELGIGEIRYRLDGGAEQLYGVPLTVTLPTTLTATTYLQGVAIATPETRVIDAASLLRREDDDLKLCQTDLALRLDDDAPIAGERETFTVDIVRPCWIYVGAVMDGVTGLKVTVGQVPWNYQVGALEDTIDIPTPLTPDGELTVRAGGCVGEPISVLSLAPARDTFATTVLEGSLPDMQGAHDLCFTFRLAGHDPIWTVGAVQLLRD